MKNLCLILTGLLMNAWVYGQKLHVVFVIEKEDINFGLLNLRNEELMMQIMETVKWGLNYPMQTTYLSGAKFTATAVKKAIVNLKTNSKDIVVVYFAGFGIAQPDDKSLFANWKLRDTPKMGLSVGEVERWLIAKQRAKKLRLGLILAECSEQSIKQKQKIRASIGLRIDLRRPVIRKLFLENCGIIKMGSSLPYESSWITSDGPSLFTSSFHRAFETMLTPADSSALQRTSFQQLQSLTSMFMGQYFYDMGISQTPVLEIKSCKGAAANVIIGPIPDSLVSQTTVLNGLLNGLSQNRDSVQRAQIRRKIMSYFAPTATVSLSSYYLNTAIPEVKTYPLKQYLDDIHLAKRNPKYEMMVLDKEYLFIEKMEVNASNPRAKWPLVEQVAIVEFWGEINRPR
ncbi:hypothetical protein [Runella salmonicolor]|uniref:Caspase domain-containing protein n=1 Tax=Runella salmonicolor TaxID=2950278 RepID=A0ABT1FL28_9BACT|nr:hypothetical protein [Runella salmonicolor]MCP1381227.1 hypothetical protein [Runella salmonicolor]